MGEIAIFAGLGLAAVVCLFRPWVGILLTYLFTVLQPQAVWFWHFQEIRPVLWITVPTLLGFAVAALRGQVEWAAAGNARTFFFCVLWFAVAVSYAFGPYVDALGPYRFTDPDWAFDIFNKVAIVYLLGLVLVASERRILAISCTIAASGAYLVYWANHQYLSGASFGRLSGPVDVFGSGIYSDANNFAMAFVVCMPFLWYLSFAVRSTVLRLAVWAVIPLAWHAVFLTASRGGLIGLAVTTALVAFRSRNRALGILLIPALLVAYMWQAGDLMKERARTIDEFTTEASAAGRLEAWQAALKVGARYPLTGAGIASFGPAFPTVSDKKPREAHNTVLQLLAESGPLAAVGYIGLATLCIVPLWRNGKRLLRTSREAQQNTMLLLNEAVLAGLVGVVVCSLFLSLQLFQLFYCMCFLAGAILYASRDIEAGASAVPHATSSSGRAAPIHPERRTSGVQHRPVRPLNGPIRSGDRSTNRARDG